MISLKDSIEINATPEQLFTWLSRLPDVYTTWHPDHVSCRILHGSILEVGSEFEAEEYLHGKLHSMRFRMTKVIPDQRMEYLIPGMGGGAFEAQDTGDKILFIAELNIGSDAPILGPFFDFIFTSFFKQRINDMRQHMIEEGQNLKALLESDPQ